MENDFLADSQQSQELFSQEARALPPLAASTEVTSVDKTAASRNVMDVLTEILNEQKKLREEIYKLNCTLEASQAQKCAIVEGSPIEKEYINFLKERFSLNPWISFQEPETQNMLQKLIKKAGWSDSSGRSLSVLATFGSKKFTHYRNQVRSKLTGNKEVDVEGLALKSLHNYLWKCFLPSHVPILDTQRQHLTLMLRSFCGAEKLFRKGGTAGL